MNTRQAVERYGVWAVHAGAAAQSRSILGWAGEASANRVRENTMQYLSAPWSDVDYNAETAKAIATRARTRPK